MAVAVNKGAGDYAWKYERVWLEASQSGVGPFFIGNWNGRMNLPPKPTPEIMKAFSEGAQFLPHLQKNRVGCFDLTVTFSKSLSFLAYGMTPPDQWKSWTDLFVRVSSPEIKALVEDQLANSGAQGATKEPSKGGAVGYLHNQSYLGLPHAHGHFMIPNVTCTQQGRVGSIANAHVMFDRQGIINARINKNLDDQLQDRGFATIRVGNNVELAGVPRALIDEISPARQAMNQAQAQKGFSGPAAQDFYARQARRDEGHRVVKAPDEMHRDSKELADRYGVTLHSLKRDPQVPPPSKDPVTSMSAAYDVAIEARDACVKKYGSFTADQYQERLYTLGIGRATTMKDLDTVGIMVLEKPKFAGVRRETMADGSFRYATKESKAREAKLEQTFVRDAWDQFAAAGKNLGATVLVATALKTSEVLDRIREAVNPQPKEIVVDARKLADFNRAHRPTHYLLAHAKAILIGGLSPGNPHEKAGVAEKAYASLRHHEKLPRNAVVVVKHSTLANTHDLEHLKKIAKRDGCSVSLADRPDTSHAQSQAKSNAKQHQHGHGISP